MHKFSNIETSKINEQLPIFIRENAQVMVRFLEEYYDYVNQKDNPSYVLNRIIEEHDIDQIVDPDYLDRLKFEIASSVPESAYVIKSFLFKRIVEYYEVRGSTESIPYFFRIFFNDDITIYFPWDRVLIPSESTFNRPVKIRVVKTAAFPDVDVNDFLGKTIYQPATKAQAFVRSVITKPYGDETIYDLILIENTIRGTFRTNLEVTTLEDSNLSAEVYRSLVNIIILEPGNKYQVGDTITVPNIEQETFKASIDLVGDNGEAKRIRIADFGSGNTVNYTIKRLINFNFGGDTEYLGDTVEYIDDIVVASTIKNEIVVATNSGNGLVIALQFGALLRASGTYLDDKSHLSGSSAVLQDSFYHQRFSYEITSNVPYSIWKEAYRDFLHPSGTMLFSAIRNETIFDNSLSSTGLDVTVEIPEVPSVDDDETLEVTNNIKAFAQNYFKHTWATDINTYDSYLYEDDGPYVIKAGTINEITDVEGTTTTTDSFGDRTQGF